jgi:transposase
LEKEVTEELECEAVRFFIRRYIRYEYAAKKGDTILKGGHPERVTDKGIHGAGLLAMIITNKYVDDLFVPRETMLRKGEYPDPSSTIFTSWLNKLYPNITF